MVSYLSYWSLLVLKKLFSAWTSLFCDSIQKYMQSFTKTAMKKNHIDMYRTACDPFR